MVFIGFEFIFTPTLIILNVFVSHINITIVVVAGQHHP